MRWYLPVACALVGCATADRGGGSTNDANAAQDARRDPDAASLACTGTDTCQGAMMLGTVSGDTGNMKLMATGYRAAWVRVRVTENNNSIGGLTLRVAARVNSPPNVKFDPVIYVNTGSDQIECSTTSGTPTTTGNLTEIKAEWGEGNVPNGEDDSRDVSIEIRPNAMSGCNSGQTWMLEVEGNWI